MSKVVIVIPTYKEAQNIGPIIKRVYEVLPEVHVLVADDNSPDGTADIVRKLAEKNPRITLLSRPGKEGIGKAYLHAFSEVLKDPQVDWVQMLDADFSHDPKYLPTMLKKAETADVVIGSRYVEGGGTVGWPLWRRVLSRCANFYSRRITGMPIHDTTAGFILMRASFMRAAGLDQIRSSGHAFMMELKYRLWRAGARITEVPVLLEDRRLGQSKVAGHIIREAAIAPWKMRFGAKVKATKVDAALIGVIALFAFVGIWHSLPMMDVVADESYFVRGVLHALEAHRILPVPGDVPYGTLFYFINYPFQLLFLFCLFALHGFHVAAFKTFLVLNPAINFIVPRFVSALIAVIFAVFYNRYLREEGILLVGRVASLAVIFTTIISGIMLHTGKLWAFSMTLAMTSLLMLYRSYKLKGLDPVRSSTSAFWSVLLSFIAAADFPFAFIFLVSIPLTLSFGWRLLQFRTAVLRAVGIGIALLVFVFLINEKAIIGQVVGLFTVYKPLLGGTVPHISFGRSLALHAVQIFETFPLTLLLIVFALITRSVRDTTLFVFSLCYALLAYLTVSYMATWYDNPSEWLLYCLPYAFFFSGMVAALMYESLKPVLITFTVLQVALYVFALTLFALPTTYNVTASQLTKEWGNSHILLYSGLPQIVFPLNQESAALLADNFCGERCMSLRTSQEAGTFKAVAVSSKSNLTHVKLASYDQLLYVGEKQTANCVPAPIKTVLSGASDQNYVSVEYNLGNYFLPDFWKLSRYGKNLYVYELTQKCFASLIKT